MADKVRSRWVQRSQALGGDWSAQNQPSAAADTQGGDGQKARPGSNWWSKDHPQLANWYYHHDWQNHDWRYWWASPGWNDVNAWLSAWGITGGPLYYDYGPGGNVVYQGGNVYINGLNVGSDAQFAQTAAAIAVVPAEVTLSTPTNEAWLPLGTFAVVMSKQDVDPTRLLQLAVDRQGIVSGTMHNSATDQSYVVQGRVDKRTQRVAFNIGDKWDVVMETGLYNLTQPEAPALVHFGADRSETILLVHVHAPAATGDGSSSK